jgi:hypothetical protein
MLETTRDFFNDALNFQLGNPQMPDILRTLAGLDSHLPLGVAAHEFHKLTPRERNYICCVLLERDQDIDAWQRAWSEMEAEAFG